MRSSRPSSRTSRKPSSVVVGRPDVVPVIAGWPTSAAQDSQSAVALELGACLSMLCCMPYMSSLLVPVFTCCLSALDVDRAVTSAERAPNRRVASAAARRLRRSGRGVRAAQRRRNGEHNLCHTNVRTHTYTHTNTVGQSGMGSATGAQGEPSARPPVRPWRPPR